MTRYGETRKSLGKHSLAPKKKFGQNFLVHKATAEAIVRCGRISTEDIVIEVGVGLGALTQPLANQARQVIGVEIDSGIIRFHEEEQDLPENVRLIHQDILKCDFNQLADACGGRFKIMANLPYSISNPFIFKLIENRQYITEATIMLQKEVAERLMALPGTKEYGVPSVLLQSCATLSKQLTLKPSEFHPRPKVDSVVIRIEFSQKPFQSAAGTPFTYSLFNKIVRCSFNQRRKTVLNTLSAASFFKTDTIIDKQTNKMLTEQSILDSELSPTARPESLSLEDFINLTVTFEKNIKLHLK